MRVAVIVVFVSLLTTRSEASTSCMSKTEARQQFGTVYLYWHGPEHCWDATPTRLHGVRHRVRHPEPTPHFVVPIPSPDLRRSANAMAPDEPETELITVIPWVERWTDITQRTPPASIVVTARADGHVARRGDGYHRHRTDACGCRVSVWRHEIGWTHSSPSSRSKTMTDEHLAAMHKLLAEYHRKLAKAAVLDIVQQYHVDLAQRFADEAAQIPRRTAILERLNEREQQEKMASTRLEPWMIM